MCWRGSFCDIVPRIAKVLLFWPSTKLKKIYRWVWWARENKRGSHLNGTNLSRWFCSSFLTFYSDKKKEDKGCHIWCKSTWKRKYELVFWGWWNDWKCYSFEEFSSAVCCVALVVEIFRGKVLGSFLLCIHLDMWLCVYWGPKICYKIGCSCVLVYMCLYTTVYSLEICPSFGIPLCSPFLVPTVVFERVGVTSF